MTSIAAKWYFLILLLFTAIGCDNKMNLESSIPDEIRQLPNLTVIDTTSIKYDLRLEKDLSLDQMNFDFIQSLWDVYSDLFGNIYWADNATVKIHQFDSGGNFLHSIGKQGRGPGELEFLRSSSVYGNHMFLLEHASQDVHVYDVESGEYIETLNIRIEAKGDEFPSRFSDITAVSDSSFYAFLKRSPRDPDDIVRLYKFSLKTGEGVELLEFPDHDMIVQTRADGSSRTFADFMARSEIGKLKNERFLHAHAGNGLIRFFDNQGEYKKAMYIDFTPKPLSNDDIRYVVENSNPMLAPRVEAADELPDLWPVWHRLFSDPFDNIWVEMNINPPRERELWVISPEGHLLGKSDSRNLGWIRFIDDKYLYSTQNDGGIHTLERYRVVME
jgi:hypothetical protein